MSHRMPALPNARSCRLAASTGLKHQNLSTLITTDEYDSGCRYDRLPNLHQRRRGNDKSNSRNSNVHRFARVALASDCVYNTPGQGTRTRMGIRVFCTHHLTNLSRIAELDDMGPVPQKDSPVLVLIFVVAQLLRTSSFCTSSYEYEYIIVLFGVR
eukprot:scaffold275595_cov41-Prasinocladus_malaysianus.AAC.1